MIVPDDSDGWKVVGRVGVADTKLLAETAGLGANQEETTVKFDTEAAGQVLTGVKRDLEDDSGQPGIKRSKLGPELDQVSMPSLAGDVFLCHGERAKLKKELSVSNPSSP